MEDFTNPPLAAAAAERAKQKEPTDSLDPGIIADGIDAPDSLTRLASQGVKRRLSACMLLLSSQLFGLFAVPVATTLF